MISLSYKQLGAGCFGLLLTLSQVLLPVHTVLAVDDAATIVQTDTTDNAAAAAVTQPEAVTPADSATTNVNAKKHDEVPAPKKIEQSTPAPQATPAATAPNGTEVLNQNKSPQEPKKVYVCKYVGTPGVNERLQTGQNPIEVSVNAIENNGWSGTLPGYFSDAQGRSYVLGYVGEMTAPTIADCPNVVSINVMITQTTICGPNNDIVTVAPQTGVTFSQSAWVNNQLIVTAQLLPGYTWSDNTVAAKTFVRTDQATVCEPTKLPVPAKPSVNDPCGPRNASWVVPMNTNQISWTITNDGHLLAQTAPGFIFTDGSTTHDYGYPHDKNKPCPAKPCTVKNNTYGSAWKFDGETFPQAGDGGSYEFRQDGLYVSTPDIESYTYGLIDAGKTRIIDIDEMSYKTLRLASSTGNNQVTVGYVLFVDKDADLLTTGDQIYFIYEPIYNGMVVTGEWQTWDTINGGNALWWGDGSGDPNKTWDYIRANYPNAIVLAYGFNQGTYNQGTNSAVQDIVFDCAKTHFTVVPGKGGGPMPPISVTPPAATVKPAKAEGGRGAMLAPLTGVATSPTPAQPANPNLTPIMILVMVTAGMSLIVAAQRREQ